MMDKVKLLKNRNYAPESLGKTCVLGLGKTGKVVADYLLDNLGNRVSSVHVYAGKKSEFSLRNADKLIKRGASVSFDDEELFENYDLCVVSPGIPQNSNIYISAKNKSEELIGEIELAWRESNSEAKWIAITGTNGKTTTTELTCHILNNTNLRAVSVGNIGNVALDAVAKDERKSIYMKTNVYVAEISSYQLHSCSKFAPYAACLLNITPDHIDWHGSFDAYKHDKLKVFSSATYAVINGEDKVASSQLDKISHQKNIKEVIINNSHAKDIIVNRNNEEVKIAEISDLKIFGEHNCVNARAAASLCMLLSVPVSVIEDGLKSFDSLEHRIEPCGIIAGIRLYNDSKATNTDATIQAIGAFEKSKAIFLLGGKDKKTDIQEMAKRCLDHLKGVVVFGEARERFFDAFKKEKNQKENCDFLLLQASNMKEAFKIAMENAFPGEFVVLSPACSSFDEFGNFEERGKEFKKLVEACKK